MMKLPEHDGLYGPLKAQSRPIQTELTAEQRKIVLDTLTELNDTQARHAVGQIAMRDSRIAQLVALFEMSDERGKLTLLAFAGIHAARYPREK